MTTPKNMVIPGTVVKVSIRKCKAQPLSDTLSAATGPLGTFFLSSSKFTVGTGNYTASNGDVLEIVSKPKTYDGIKYVLVRHQGKDYRAYYVQIRYDTTPV